MLSKNTTEYIDVNCEFGYVVDDDGNLLLTVTHDEFMCDNVVIDYTGTISIHDGRNRQHLRFSKGKMLDIDDKSINHLDSFEQFRDELACLVDDYGVKMFIELYRETGHLSSEREKDDYLIFSHTYIDSDGCGQTGRFRIPERASTECIQQAEIHVK